MNRFRFLKGAVTVLTALTTLSTAAFAADKTSPSNDLDYSPRIAGQGTFEGSTTTTISGEFTISAPAAGDSKSKFPEGSSVNATVTIKGIERTAVLGADGKAVDLEAPESFSIDSGVGKQIANAFTITPASVTLSPSSTHKINVTVANPNVAASDYGDYLVTIKGIPESGSGIGQSSGSQFTLSLRPAALRDIVAPNVTINTPADGSVLAFGPVEVKITANDVVGPVATGVKQIIGSIASAGGTVNQTLSLNNALFTPTVPAGTDAVATANLSSLAIGNYRITANAVDGAGNWREFPVSSTFTVKYNVEFTRQDCLGAKSLRFEFLVKDAAGNSLNDASVVVQLVDKATGNVVRTHSFGTGSVHDVVQIETLADGSKQFKTTFRKSDLTSSSSQYTAVVWFADVDGNLLQHASSIPLTFSK